MNRVSDKQLTEWFKQYTDYEVDEIYVREFRRWVVTQVGKLESLLTDAVGPNEGLTRYMKSYLEEHG